MNTVKQATAAPKRKLLGAATIGAALGEVVNNAIDQFPTLDAVIGTSSVEMLVLSLATFAVGYMVEEWNT